MTPRTASLLATAAFALVAAAPPVLAAGTTERVSVGSNEQQGNDFSVRGGLSGNSQLIVFASRASNFAAGDSNSANDIFLRNRGNGLTRLISRSTAGAQGDGESDDPAISRGGRFVAYGSFSTNLVPGDTNATQDVFLYNMMTRATTRVSVGPGGAEANGESRMKGLSGDGRLIVFNSFATNLVTADANGFQDVFVHDRIRGVTSRESVALDGGDANGNSAVILFGFAPQSGAPFPAISREGRFLVFGSTASNLVAGDANGFPDIFLRDRRRGRTVLVSLANDETPANGFSGGAAVSDSGRYVTFTSVASNLVPGDTNNTFDVFIRDRQAGTTRRVSQGPGGAQADGGSFNLALSPDGRYVVYTSLATNLVPDDTNGINDIFVFDRNRGTTRRLVGNRGEQPNAPSAFPAISPDGKRILFSSEASNLVADDDNASTDVFLTDQHVRGAAAQADGATTRSARPAPATGAAATSVDAVAGE